MTAAELAALPDALWEKHKGTFKISSVTYTGELMFKIDFLAALHEYGQAVRKRDAEICRAYTQVKSDSGLHSINLYTHHGNESCAAAIEQEKLP